MATTVTAKGQVTIPKAVREFLGIGPGSMVDFKRAADGNIMLVPANDAKPVKRFERLLGHAGPGPSTDEIMALLRGEP
jgi:antitoxin PrlF